MTEDAAVSRIGRFAVLRKLGEGGMGVVHACFDPDLDRKVAVKLVRRVDDADIRSRMVREAQALARLAHPNVVTIFEVGEHEGQVYLAMEYIKGRTLRAFVDDERPEWRTIARIYLQAGRGLAAAHASALIHRDFKPDNAIVGDDGRVRVLDFGLARKRDDADAMADAPVNEHETLLPPPQDAALSTPLTAVGAVMGTPAYMAPEQLLGEAVDARADQFAFAVALWEALYGARPFSGKTRLELAAAVTRGKLPRVDAVHVPGWFRVALARALSPAPVDRWPRLDDLLDVIDRRLARSRRSALLLTGFGLVAVAGPLSVWALARQRCGGAGEQLAPVWNDDVRDEIRTAITATSVSYAADTADRVEQALQSYAEAWMASHSDACVATERGEQSHAAMDLRMTCLRRELVALEARTRLLRDVDDAAVEHAVELVPTVTTLRGCADVGLLEARAAEVAPPRAEIAAEVEAIRAEVASARALSTAQRHDAALELTEALHRRATTLGYAPLSAEVSLALADVLLVTEQDLQRVDGALADALRLALESHRWDLAVSAASLRASVLGMRQGRFDEATLLADLAVALAHSDEVARLGALGSRGLVRVMAGRTDDGAAVLREVAEALRRDYPDHEQRLSVTINLGVALQDARPAEALLVAEEALAIAQARYGMGHPETAHAECLIAKLLFDLGRYDESAAIYERAVRLYAQTLGEHAERTIGHRGDLALAYVALGRAAEGLSALRDAVKDAEQHLGVGHLTTLRLDLELARIEIAQGAHAEAVARLERLLDRWTRTLGPGHPDLEGMNALLAEARAAPIPPPR